MLRKCRTLIEAQNSLQANLNFSNNTNIESVPRSTCVFPTIYRHNGLWFSEFEFLVCSIIVLNIPRSSACL